MLVAQLCLTLCDCVDCSPPGSSVHGIFQARIVEWVAISFSRGSSPSRDWTCVSCIGRQILYHCATWEALFKWSGSRSVTSDSLWPHGLYSPWSSLGQNTEVSSLSLLQGIFPTHRSNPGLLYCRRILCQLIHKGSPRILEWLAYAFSRGSSQSRIEPGSPALRVDSLPTELWGKPSPC